MNKILRYIDSITQWIGDFFPPLMIVMACATAWEVVKRYIFGAPTMWVWPLNIYLLAMIGLAGGYCSLKNTHIRVDVISNKFPKRLQTFFEVVTAPLMFLFIGCAVWWTFSETLLSFRQGESDIHWQTPVPPYFFKGIVCVAAIMFLLQGISKFIRDIRRLIYGDEKEGTAGEVKS